MKSYDSRTYSINDFVEWDKAGQLELNPRFQRRPVWTDKAKSFLIDTILRGKPIPKIFIRQKINVSTKPQHATLLTGSSAYAQFSHSSKMVSSLANARIRSTEAFASVSSPRPFRPKLWLTKSPSIY